MGTKLKSRLFRNMLMLSAVCVMAAVGISAVILYKNIEKRIAQENEADAVYLSYFAERLGAGGINDMKIPDEKRITLISEDGAVLYDSMADEAAMDNHMDRPEIAAAAEYGSGSDKRLSDTLSEMSYYYAIRLSDGSILRVATTADTVYSAFKAVIPMAVILTLCVIAAAAAVSGYLTRKIVRPINNADIEEPHNIVIYDELAPFVSRIRQQREVIGRQIRDLRNKRLEFETITENMNEGLLVAGDKGRIISYNKSALRLLNAGSPEGALNNALCFNRSAAFARALEEALGGREAECRLNIQDRVCQIIANPVMDCEKAIGAVVLIIDITEKEKREALRREFSANVSHELKTPLTSIAGYAEIMKLGMVKADDTVKFAEIIYSEAHRMIDLVGDIIKVSKLDEDDIQMDIVNIDLYGMSKDIAERLKKTAEQAGVSIFVNTEENSRAGISENMEKNAAENAGAYSIDSYPQIVGEMIYNITDNAIKYNKRGGKVIISLSADETSVTVSVKDTGIGIPKQDIDRVFERFYRADKSRSREIGGTGLGLSIVKHSAALVGAEVSLESEEGLGTEVTLKVAKKIQKNI